MLSRYRRPDPIHVTIRHTDHKRPETGADGIRRKQKMAETALESDDSPRKFGLWPVGFPDMLSRYHHSGPIHVTIRHTDQERPETAADGRWHGSRRKLTESGK